MRLPNGFGTVYKLSGKRRRPWIARTTTGWDIIDDNEKQVIETIGYYETRAEAITALSSYNMNPYDLKKRKLTFYQVFEMWYADYKNTVGDSVIRATNISCKHAQDLHDMIMSEITVNQLEHTIKACPSGDATKKNIKELFNKMYRYALKHDIVTRNLAELCDPVTVHTQIVRQIFTEDEITKLWPIKDDPVAAMILISIYSGWRCVELLSLKPADIDFENMTMLGGVKTDAGKDRYVPIHQKIESLVRTFYDRAIENGYSYIFTFPGKDPDKPISYHVYSYRFSLLMEKLGMEHSPHETRHTFVTKAKEAGMDEYVLKLIIGHHIEDLTERVYTHRKFEQLREEMEKIQ